MKQLTARIELGLASPVHAAAVDLEGHALLHQVLHGLKGWARVAWVGLVEVVRSVVEARHEVEVPHEATVRAVIHLRLELIVGASERVPVTAKGLEAELLQHLIRPVHGHEALVCGQKVRRSDHVLRLRAAGGIVDDIELDAHEDIEPLPIDPLQAADLCHVGGPVHVDARIHVAREAQVLKAKVQRALDHLLSGVLAIAEHGMGVIVRLEHEPSSQGSRRERLPYARACPAPDTRSSLAY